jgi:hypothetical protein
MNVEISGLGKQQQHFSNMMDIDRYDKALSEVVYKTVGLMKLWCPRWRGFLEETINILHPKKLHYMIWIPAVYAGFTEYGTQYINIGTVNKPMLVKSLSGKMSYRPWARPAVWHYNKQASDIVKQVLFKKR